MNRKLLPLPTEKTVQQYTRNSVCVKWIDESVLRRGIDLPIFYSLGRWMPMWVINISPRIVTDDPIFLSLDIPSISTIISNLLSFRLINDLPVAKRDWKERKRNRSILLCSIGQSGAPGTPYRGARV